MLTPTFDPKVKVVLDSISPEGIRLPTVQFRQPRMIHADFLTHRVFSRNGRSSRAVPVATLLEEAKDPYVPHFLKNKPGMMATEEMSDAERAEAEHIWRQMAEFVRQGVSHLNLLGVHKQWANRPLEWFGYIDVLLTSTDWNNYFALRDDKGAQPEIQIIAKAIKDALDASTPKHLRPGQWHLPYIEESDHEAAYEFLNKNRIIRSLPGELEVLDLLKKISAARCARLTIKPFDGDGSFEKELDRYNKLIESQPVHASPVEHQATPDESYTCRVLQTKARPMLGELHDGVVNVENEFARNETKWRHPELHGNFTGWIQARKLIPNERVL